LGFVCPFDTIRVMGRATQGVKLIDLEKRGDKIASVCKVDSQPEEEDAEDPNASVPESHVDGLRVDEGLADDGSFDESTVDE